MSDLATPPAVVVPTFINSWSKYMVGLTLRSINAAANLTATTLAWTANVALFIPLVLPWPYPVRRVLSGAGSGTRSTWDVGIYTRGGARIVSLGGVAGGAGNSLNYSAASWKLDPGCYYLGISSSDSTGRFEGNAVSTAQGRLAGLLQQSSAYPLPASATFAAYAGVGLPIVGLTTTPSGF